MIIINIYIEYYTFKHLDTLIYLKYNKFMFDSGLNNNMFNVRLYYMRYKLGLIISCLCIAFKTKVSY